MDHDGSEVIKQVVIAGLENSVLSQHNLLLDNIQQYKNPIF